VVSSAILSTREQLSDQVLAKGYEMFSKYRPDIVEDFLDEYYMRDLLNRVPKMVKRTAKLSTLPVGKIPSGSTNAYLREATRTYVLGLWQASVSLSRAALEQGLQEVTKSTSQQKLSELIEYASRLRLLTHQVARSAHAVKAAADQVLHRSPCNEHQAWDVLSNARLVLGHIFSARP